MRAEITAEHQPHSQLCQTKPHQISRINSWEVDVAQAGSCVTAAGISVPALTAAGNVAFAATILLHPALSCPQRGDLLPAKALGARNNTCPRWKCSIKPIGECQLCLAVPDIALACSKGACALSLPLTHITHSIPDKSTKAT